MHSNLGESTPYTLNLQKKKLDLKKTWKWKKNFKNCETTHEKTIDDARYSTQQRRVFHTTTSSVIQFWANITNRTKCMPSIKQSIRVDNHNYEKKKSKNWCNLYNHGYQKWNIRFLCITIILKFFQKCQITHPNNLFFSCLILSWNPTIFWDCLNNWNQRFFHFEFSNTQN